MGFKEENYTPKGLCLCICFLMVTLSQDLQAQAPHCPIRVEFEPKSEFQSRTANTLNEVPFPFFSSWQDLDLLRASDDKRASVFLSGSKRSTLIKGSNLGINIPDGANITGIEIQIEGHSLGEGFVEAMTLKLMNENGQSFGLEMAQSALPEDKDWLTSADSTDFNWRYGSKDQNWGVQLNKFLVSSPNFGYALQIRNKLNKPITVFIDQIRVIVHYTPLYQICTDHACVPFYIDHDENSELTYNWSIPQGFELISTSEEADIINIGVSYADFGTYEICVEAFENQSSIGTCCRKFNYNVCSPGHLSGTIFNDTNNNSQKDITDIRAEGKIVNLYTKAGVLLSTTVSDNQGKYEFTNLLTDEYYIEVIKDDSTKVFSFPNKGSEAVDSDITEDFGPGTSELISLFIGDTLTNIDAGFGAKLNLGNFIWEDLNGDGIQQIGEPGISNALIELTNIYQDKLTTSSDANGIYSFTSLPAGNYSISILLSENFSPTISNTGTSSTDSDFSGFPLDISFPNGGNIDSLDAGFYRDSDVGDFVWLDENENGIQDINEPGLEGVMLMLLDTSGVLIKTISTDSLGFYQFNGLIPGLYKIEFATDPIFVATSFQLGNNDTIDSDALFDSGVFRSPIFSLISNTSLTSLDFGLIELPASLGGFTWIDENNDGQYADGEAFLDGVTVLLLDVNDIILSSTITDFGGFYIFENISSGEYHLNFELPLNHTFTLSDVGDDLSDSDVINFIDGSTSSVNLEPGEINLSFSAGFQINPKFGDYVWLDVNSDGIQDESENGINDVWIKLFDSNQSLLDSTLTSTNPLTGLEGYYLFDSLDIGLYYIQVPELDQLDFTLTLSNDPSTNSDITGINGFGTSDFFELVGNQCLLDIDAGYKFDKGGIQGEVWIDFNEDGIQDLSDSLVSSSQVDLYNSTGIFIKSVLTNELGQYAFNTVDEGDYYITFDISSRYKFTTPNIGVDENIDSDVTESTVLGGTDLITVINGVTIENVDAGLIDGAIAIDGFTWVDKNADGIRQLTEIAIPGIQVDLFTIDSLHLQTRTTDEAGQYAFDKAPEGSYFVVFSTNNNLLQYSPADQGLDDEIDSDLTSTFQIGSTDTIQVAYFQELSSVSAGYFEFSTIGDMVFFDLNENGINDFETGLNGVIINLLDESGNVLDSEISAQGGGLDSGHYQFLNIPPGIYQLEFLRPLFYQFTDANQGTDNTLDSDVEIIENNLGRTGYFEVCSGSAIDSIDAGLVFRIPMESSFTGLIWNDSNANGIRETNESSVINHEVRLLDPNDNILETTTTNSNGEYTFDNLLEGFYRIEITNPNGFTTTLANIGSDDTIDSDFINDDNKSKSDIILLSTFEDYDNLDLGLVPVLTIGDLVWEDINLNGKREGNELGVEGIEIVITNSNGSFTASTFSNEAGFYQFIDIPAGNYEVCATSSTNFDFTIQNIGSDELDSDVDSTGCTPILDFTSGGVVNNVDIGITYRGDLSGLAFVDLNGNGVRNPTDPGLEDVVVELYTAAGELVESTSTFNVNDTSGLYKFVNIKAADYYIVFDFPENYIITNPNVGDDQTDSDITSSIVEGSTDIFTISSDQSITNIWGGAYLPASIGDQVWMDENKDGLKDQDETGVSGIQVILFRSFGIPIDTTVTDAEGLYNFTGLKQGLYFIQFVIPQEYMISPSDQGIDDNIDSDADQTGVTPLISLAHGADLKSVDCGIYAAMASLRSVVWNDLNGDGMRQITEARIPGIQLYLMDSEDNMIDSTWSNPLGMYAFENIPEGGYKVYVNLANSETDYGITTVGVGDDEMLDNDIYETGESEIFFSSTQLSVPNVDAGLFEAGGIMSSIWEDENADGIYDLEETPLNNVEVFLYSADGTLYQSQISNSKFENIYFTGIRPGEYFIRYKPSSEHALSPKSMVSDEDNNSDGYEIDGSFRTPIFKVESGNIVSNIDAGFYVGSSIVSQVWLDANVNGIQDEQSQLSSIVYVSLYHENGKIEATKGLDIHQRATFKGVPQGKYYFKYYSINPLNFTIANSDSKLNSDVNGEFGAGTTGLVQLDPYGHYTDIDAGLLLPQHLVDNNEILSSSAVSEDIAMTRRLASAKIDALQINIHPNPAVNYLEISINPSDEGGVVTIENDKHQIVIQQEVRDFERINVMDLHPGIYFVRYQNAGRSVTKKLIKIQ